MQPVDPQGKLTSPINRTLLYALEANRIICGAVTAIKRYRIFTSLTLTFDRHTSNRIGVIQRPFSIYSENIVTIAVTIFPYLANTPTTMRDQKQYLVGYSRGEVNVNVNLDSASSQKRL